jgi:hypothetical protein
MSLSYIDAMRRAYQHGRKAREMGEPISACVYSDPALVKCFRDGWNLKANTMED